MFWKGWTFSSSASDRNLLYLETFKHHILVIHLTITLSTYLLPINLASPHGLLVLHQLSSVEAKHYVGVFFFIGHN